MKFVTFNLRADYGDGADGGNAFCCRQPLIAKVLQAEQPPSAGCARLCRGTRCSAVGAEPIWQAKR